MAKLFPKAQLVHLRSTRDTRDRLDLITREGPVDAKQIRADRVICHPGDTSAKHYHLGTHKVFCVLDGQGLIHVDEENYRVSPGAVVVVQPGEVHWVENDTEANFSFVELFAPPPTESGWIDADDR
ncbi:MAG: cupin domain-containing protein [Dehalococcoidia bacterium]